MTRQHVFVLLVVLIVLALCFGGFGAPHAWGYWGWSPAGLLIVLFLIVVLVP